MPLPVYHLRRWLVAIAVVCTLVVAGKYLRVRLHQLSVLRNIPGKIGVDVKETATGFQYSKSDGQRTLFSIEASDLKEFKLNSRAELHKVSIVLYGRESSRFDRIYGDDFSYDPKSGVVSAKGDVQIDLEANPTGRSNPDQSAPKEPNNPIHLKTRDLTFNRETGNAVTVARVEFRTPQATGSAVGVQYAGKTNTLILASQVRLEMTGHDHSTIEAASGLITGDPRIVLLDHPKLLRGNETLQADRAKMFLTADNNVERIVAEGNVRAQMDEEGKGNGSRGKHTQKHAVPAQPAETRVNADQAEFLLTSKQNRLRTATLTGHVEFDRAGAQPLQGMAGRVILDYSGQNELQKVHALDHVRLTQSGAKRQNAAGKDSSSDFAMTASAVDFRVGAGRFLDRAETFGPAQITILSTPAPAQPNTGPQQTLVTAGKFSARFETVAGSTRLTAIHGAPDARIVNHSPGQPTRTSASESVDASFLAEGGIAAVTQQGSVTYTDDQPSDKRTQATADQARYTPTDQMLELTGSARTGNPRISEGGMATTAKTIRINRATGEALAESDVKSTYSELLEQPNGSLLASSSPIHVTARSMTAGNHPAIAVYSGDARLWQDANVIEAPTIQFDREHRSLVAQGTPARPVSTILVQPQRVQSPQAQPQRDQPESTQLKEVPPLARDRAKPWKKRGVVGKPDGPSLLAITAARLTYTDSERKAHYEGGVSAKSADFTASAQNMDVYLLPRNQGSGQTTSHQSVTGQGRIDRVVAQGHVLVQQPNRRAEGETLVYTNADDKFVLTGGPPSIFDAEQGKITGVSLTFFRADDRVLVEGEASTPVVTQTRVAR
ncbi:MAG TPA: LptA/OstA family protein [Candidatus Sulfotelmatobacter sp.]